MMFEGIRKKPTRYVLGMSCGTDARGAEAAVVRIRGTGRDLHIKLLKHKNFPYPSGLRTRLTVARKEAREVCLLNFELGEFLADGASEMIRLAQADLTEIDFVSVDGFTISHCPPRGYDQAVGTFEVGEPAVIAEKTQHPVVSGFRARDIAAGGQGGPLSAYADWVMFRREDRVVARIHLGGITTVSVLPQRFEDIIAFDAGPGILAIDGACRLLTSGNADTDKRGAAAARGVVIDEFLEFLLDHPYFAKVPPKTTARDEFGPEVYLRDALAGRKDRSFEDMMATVTSAVSYCIVRGYNRFVKPQFNVTRIVLSGCGVENQALVQRVKNGISESLIRASDEYGLPADSVDAVAAAILGNETLCGTPQNVPHATGAKGPVILGKITPA